MEKISAPLTATSVAVDGSRVRTICLSTSPICSSLHIRDYGFDPLFEKFPHHDFITALGIQLIQTLKDTEKETSPEKFMSYLSCIFVYFDWPNFTMQDLDHSIFQHIRKELEITIKNAFPQCITPINIIFEPKIAWCALEGMKLILQNKSDTQRMVIFETIGSKFVAF
jgi:hypothetical protein